MTNDICEIMAKRDSVKHATDTGTRVHDALRHVVIDGAHVYGDAQIANEIAERPEVAAFFCPESRCEVPVAATISNKFISRRIDRMIIDDATKTVKILDYKTDVERTVRRDKYVNQLHEYAAILRRIYPEYNIVGYILWTHGWVLEKII